MSTPNNELELMEARKASPDWIGIQVLTGLVASGSALFREERDTGISTDRRAMSVDLINRWSELLPIILPLNIDKACKFL